MLRNTDRKGNLTAAVREVLDTPGELLEPAVRLLMEARFGYSFSHVRLHIDSAAAVSARALGAQAYTAGSHVIFGEGHYNPKTRTGLWLLAHELAHVIQQDGAVSAPTLVASDIGSLEGAADQAADLVAAGRDLPPGFAFGVAPAGAIQCHEDIPCPGEKLEGGAGAKDIQLAVSEAVKLKYKEMRSASVAAEAVLFDLDFEHGRLEIQLPRGAKNRKWGNYLLQNLRGISKQRRPDIIDFHAREIYEVKTVNYVTAGIVQLESYNVKAELLRGSHAEFSVTEEPWGHANWYPPHVLAMPGDPLGKIICTQATDYTKKGQLGLILYDIRVWNRRRRRPSEIRIEAFDQDQAALLPMVRAQLPKTIPIFDPASPDYVIIAPQEYFNLDFVKQKTAEKLNPMRVALPVPLRGSLAAQTAGAAVALVVEVAAGVALFAATAAAVVGTTTAVGAVETVAAVETAAGTETAAAVETAAGTRLAAGSLVFPAVGAAADTAAASGATAAAIRAALASQAAKTAVTAAAGALLVIGRVKRAEAATSAPTVENLVVIQAIPTDNLEPAGGGTLRGFSNRKLTSLQCFDSSKFGVGTKVMYDDRPHFVIGRISVR